MKPRPKGIGNAVPQAMPQFPIAQVTVGHLVDRIDDQGMIKLLEEQTGEAFEHYINAWFTHQKKLRESDSYKLKPHERAFRGAEEYNHPLSRGRWAADPTTMSENNVTNQLAIALAADDWQEVMVLAGMLCVREMLYGRDAPAKPTTAPKAKAVKKTAKKKPDVKKPGRPATPAQRQKPASPKKTAPGKIATLKELVEQARPFFQKNPKLDRQGLINKIGRRYERLTTFDELRTLCAGKTVTTHSVKKPAASVDELNKAFDVEQAKVRARNEKTEKALRPRRDPTRPVVLPESSIPKGVRTKPLPTAKGGVYSRTDADHAAAFTSGKTACDFAVIETESGWTSGLYLRTPHDQELTIPLSDTGPLALDPDTAIRNVTADLLAAVKNRLKDAESDDHRELLAPHVPDLEKLRTWLLGFQAKGVEKIAFLKKQPAQLDLAA